MCSNESYVVKFLYLKGAGARHKIAGKFLLARCCQDSKNLPGWVATEGAGRGVRQLGGTLGPSPAAAQGHVQVDGGAAAHQHEQIGAGPPHAGCERGTPFKVSFIRVVR